MKIDYTFHEDAYVQKRNANEDGWNTSQQTEEDFNILKPYIESCTLDHQCDILDLGCGAGDLTVYYEKYGSSVVGIDISPTATEWAKEKTRFASFVTKNAIDHEAFAEDQFDIIVDSNCLHCIIGEDRQKLLRNLKYWLRSNGSLIVYTMCDQPGQEMLKGFEFRDVVLSVNNLAIRYIGASGIILNELEEAGFSIEKYEIIPDDLGAPVLLAKCTQSQCK